MSTILYCIILGHPTGAVKPYYIVLYWAIQLGQWNHFILYYIGPSNWGSETILYCIIVGHPTGAVKPYYIVLYWAIHLGQWNHFLLISIMWRYPYIVYTCVIKLDRWQFWYKLTFKFILLCKFEQNLREHFVQCTF